MNAVHTMIVTVDLGFPCQKFSALGLGFVVAHSVVGKLVFSVRLLGVQSRCTEGGGLQQNWNDCSVD